MRRKSGLYPAHNRLVDLQLQLSPADAVTPSFPRDDATPERRSRSLAEEADGRDGKSYRCQLPPNEIEFSQNGANQMKYKTPQLAEKENKRVAVNKSIEWILSPPLAEKWCWIIPSALFFLFLGNSSLSSEIIKEKSIANKVGSDVTTPRHHQQQSTK